MPPPAYVTDMVEGLANFHFDTILTSPLAPAQVKDVARKTRSSRDALTGDEVLKMLKVRPGRATSSNLSDCTLVTKISLIRRLFMDYPVEYPLSMANQQFDRIAVSEDGILARAPDSQLGILINLAQSLPSNSKCRSRLMSISKSSLRTQYKACTFHSIKDHCFGVDEVDKLIQKIRILPTFMDGLSVDEGTMATCKKKMKQSNMNKNENMHVINNAGTIIERATQILELPKNATLCQLIIGLCIASGRRMTEICNGMSRFEQIQGMSSGTRFFGQLKKTRLAEEEDEGYNIPLICVPYKTLLGALNEFRTRQSVKNLSNDDVSLRYQSNVRRRLRREFPEFKNVHQLRAFYAVVVNKFFDFGGYTLPRVTMHILGHSSLNNFFNYNTLSVNHIGRRKKQIDFKSYIK
jgi:ribosomal protein L19